MIGQGAVAWRVTRSERCTIRPLRGHLSPSRERIKTIAPASSILPLGEVPRRGGGAGARSAEVLCSLGFAPPFDLAYASGFGEPTSPRTGKISSPAQTSRILLHDPCRGRRELSLFGHGCAGSVCRPFGVILGMADSDPACGRPLTPALEYIRFHRPSACLSLQRPGAWRFSCSPPHRPSSPRL